VLFLVFGSSGSGKTSALEALRRRGIPRLALHDFDEIGVPPDADTAWRQRANETWVLRALELQARRIDLLLAGQTPFGELLVAPSASRLDGLAGCLLDVEERVRLERLRPRDEGWLESWGGNIGDLLAWAEWMRGHARDPGYRRRVIRGAGDPTMCWQRLDEVAAGARRWHVRVLDTTSLAVEQVADALLAWVEDQRARTRPKASRL
jgi:hypothetical protein